MSVTLTSIESTVRNLIDDNLKTFKDIFTYSTSPIFTLSESNPYSVSEAYVNSVVLSSGEWSYDNSSKVTLSHPDLTSGDTIEIDYSAYPNYSSTEIQSFIKASLVHISINNYKDFIVADSIIYPEPNDKEINLIAAITSVLIDKPVKSYRLPDVTVTYAETMTFQERIRAIISSYKRNSAGIFFVG